MMVRAAEVVSIVLMHIPEKSRARGIASYYKNKQVSKGRGNCKSEITVME